MQTLFITDKEIDPVERRDPRVANLALVEADRNEKDFVFGDLIEHSESESKLLLRITALAYGTAREQCKEELTAPDSFFDRDVPTFSWAEVFPV